MDRNNEQFETIPTKFLVFNGLLVASALLLFVVFYGGTPVSRNKNVAQVIEPIVPTAFDNIHITGKSAYVFDVAQKKVLFKKNEFAQLPLASLTKLMTAFLASELSPLNSQITIKKEFLQEEGDTGLVDGELWELRDLLDFSLLVSSNDGMRSVASVVGSIDLQNQDYDLGRKNFINKMNLKAEELGLQETYFINESGLDQGAVSGGYASAIDVTKLMQHILANKPELVGVTKYQSKEFKSLSKIHTAKNTNTDIGSIPGLIASKTGYTELAGGNLVIAFDASIGRPIIVVVLGSTEEGRFTDVSTLVNASLEYVRE